MQAITSTVSNTNTTEQQANTPVYNKNKIQILSTTASVNFLSHINNIKNFINNNQINEYPCRIIEDHNLIQTYSSLPTVATTNKTNIEFGNNNIFATTSGNTVIINKFIDGNWVQLHSLDHSTKIEKITLSPDGNYAITSSNFIHRIWDISSKDAKQLINIDNLYYSNICFRNDSKRFVIDIQDRPLQVYDLHNKQWQSVLSIHGAEFKHTFDSRQGRFIDPFLPKDITDDSWLAFIVQRFAVTSILEGSTLYSDKELFNELRDLVHIGRWKKLPWSDQPSIRALTYSDDMQLFYAYPTNEKSFIFEYVNNQWQLKLKFNGSDRNISFSPDNQRMITSFAWGEKRINKTTIWNISGNEAVKELCLDDTDLAKFSKDSKHVITSRAYKKEITIWELADDSWQQQATIKNKLFHLYDA